MTLTYARLLLRLALASSALIATAAQAVIPASQRQYLLDFYAATNGAGWTTSTNWNGAIGTECTWFGVTCDPGQNTVNQLNLPGNNLVGTLPDWSALPDLQLIGLSNNTLSGPVPAISGLSALQTFNVSRNQLTGPLPSPANLAALDAYYAFDNQLSGSIPALPGLPVLTDFMVYQNQLTGPIPALTGVPNLERLIVNNNSLTGSVPALPAGLQQLRIESNQLTGAVPAPPATLTAGGSALCPNQLTPSASPAWDAATGSTPWHAACAAPPAPGGGATAIPTLSEWGLALMSLLAAGLGMLAVRRRTGM